MTDEQLNTRIEETDLPELAACFENTEDYVEKLGLSPPQQNDIKVHSYLNNTEAGVKLALKCWIDRNLNSATYRNLLAILCSLNKGDTIVRVCKHLSRRIGKSGELCIAVTTN